MASLISYQKQVKAYDKKYGWEGDPGAHTVLHMQEELGEIARRILRFEGYKQENFKSGELGEEIADLLYLTFKLANSFELDLDNIWENMWERYEKKTSRR